MVFCRGEEYKTTERSHECIEEFGLNPVGDFIFICKQHLVSFLFLAFLCFFFPSMAVLSALGLGITPTFQSNFSVKSFSANTF